MMSEGTAETKPVETPKEEAQVAEVKTQPAETPPAAPTADSKRLLELARREAQFAKAEVARKKELEKITEEFQKIREQAEFFTKAKDIYKADPHGVLQKLGITYEDLTEAILDANEKARSGPVDVQAEVKRQLEVYELARLEEEKAAMVDRWQSEISTYVKDNSKALPHISELYSSLGGAESPEQMIWTAMEEHYAETGEVIEYKKVAETIEEYFREEWGRINAKLANGTATAAEAAQVADRGEAVKAAVAEEPTKPVNREVIDQYKKELPKQTSNDFTITNKLNTVKQSFDPNRSYDARKFGEARALEILEKYEKAAAAKK